MALQQRRGVVGLAAIGDQAGDRAEVVDQLDAVDAQVGQRGVHGQFERTGRLALVARGIAGGDGQAVAAIGQLRQFQAPVAVFVGEGAADQGAVVVDLDQAVGLGFAALQGRGGVVGGVAAGQRPLDQAGVVQHGVEDRAVGSGVVDHQGEVGLGELAGGATDFRGVGVGPLGLVAVQGDAPVALGIGHHAAEHHPGLGKDHQRSRGGGAHQGRLSVIGDAAVGHALQARLDVIQGVVDAHLRRLAPDAELQGVAGLAEVAGGVLGLHGDAVRTIGQRRLGGVVPVAQGIGHHAAQRLAVVADDDQGTRLGLAAEFRGVVVGGTVLGDQPLHHAGVVFGARLLRLVRRGAVEGDGNRDGLVAVATGIVLGLGGDDARTIVGQRQFDVPVAVLVGHHAGGQLAVDVQQHEVAGTGAAADGQAGVVGDVAIVQQPGDRAMVIGDRADDRRIRQHGRVHHLEGDGRPIGALVAGGIHRNHGEDMLADGQLRRLEAPVTLAVHQRGTQQRLAVVDFNPLGVGGGGEVFHAPFEARSGIVGLAARGDGAGDGAEVVMQREADFDGIGRRGVQRQLDVLDQDVVAGGIPGVEVDAVVPLGHQVLRPGQAPGAILGVDGHGAEPDDGLVGQGDFRHHRVRILGAELACQLPFEAQVFGAGQDLAGLDGKCPVAGMGRQRVELGIRRAVVVMKPEGIVVIDVAVDAEHEIDRAIGHLPQRRSQAPDTARLDLDLADELRHLALESPDFNDLASSEVAPPEGRGLVIGVVARLQVDVTHVPRVGFYDEVGLRAQPPLGGLQLVLIVVPVLFGHGAKSSFDIECVCTPPASR